MSDAISTQGTTISFNSLGSPGDTTPLTEVRSIGGPSETSEEIDVTHLMSLGGRREFIQSFRDTDDLTVEMNYVPGDTVQQTVRGLYESGEIVTWTIELPDGATSVFNGFVKARGAPIAVGEAVMFPITIRVTGQMTFTPSA